MTDHCCSGPHCVTCSDEALVVRVTRLLPFGLALVDTGRGGDAEEIAEEISVALVDAEIGDTVLVHAKEALAVLPTHGAAAASASVCAISGAVDEIHELGAADQVDAAHIDTAHIEAAQIHGAGEVS